MSLYGVFVPRGSLLWLLTTMAKKNEHKIRKLKKK